jgi:ribose transport system ATP-binding protein
VEDSAPAPTATIRAVSEPGVMVLHADESTSTNPPAVEVRGVSKRYGPVQALSDVSFEVARGEVVGLVGENGAGKSTLIGVLSGGVEPDRGSVRVYGQPAPIGDARRMGALGVSVVVQEQALVDSLRVYENLFLGKERVVSGRALMRSGRLRSRAADLLEELGLGSIPAAARLSDLSFPQRQLVEIAKAFVQARIADVQPVILLDEPTSALSNAETELLFALIERWRHRAAFVYVSHILADVRRLCSRLVVLRDGHLTANLRNEAITDAKLHELMVGRERREDYYLEREQTGAHSNEAVLTLDGVGAEGRFTGVDLTIRPGEVVGVAGVVGAGASDLVAVVAGAQPLTQGTIRVGDRQVRGRWSVRQAIAAGVLYVPPERSTDSVVASASVRDNISLGVLDQLRASSGLLRLREERALAQRMVRRLRIKTPSLRTPLSELSGGNQQKAVFGRWLDRSCAVLVLDDPTRGIDVGTREEIYELIRGLTRDGVAILLRSESLDELIGLSDRILVMKDGAVVTALDAAPRNKPTEYDVVKRML